MSIVYIIVKVLTLPGAILHAFFEHMVCRNAKIIVEDEKVVQFNEMLSHIDHQLIKRRGPSFDICFIPFFMNFMLGFLSLTYGSTAIIYFAKYEDIFAWICLYFGIALLTNLFPQIEDVMMLKDNYFNDKVKTISKILVAPWYGIFFLGSRLEKWGLTLLTSIGFSFLVPVILGWFIPSLYNVIK